MKMTRLSLYYLAGYLLCGGMGFLALPQTTLDLFLSSGQYGDAMVRLVGMLLIALGVVVVQLIRLQAEALYSTTLIVRSFILICLATFYILYRDPLFIVLAGIVGLGYTITLASFVWDQRL